MNNPTTVLWYVGLYLRSLELTNLLLSGILLVQVFSVVFRSPADRGRSGNAPKFPPS